MSGLNQVETFLLGLALGAYLMSLFMSAGRR